MAAIPHLGIARIRPTWATPVTHASTSLVDCLPGKPRRLRSPVLVRPWRSTAPPRSYGCSVSSIPLSVRLRHRSWFVRPSTARSCSCAALAAVFCGGSRSLLLCFPYRCPSCPGPPFFVATQKRRRAIAASKHLAMARLRLARARGWSRASPSLVFCLPGKPRRLRLPVSVHPRRLRSPPDPWGPLCFRSGSPSVFGTVRACASLGGLVLFVLCPCCGLRRRAPDWFFVCCVSRCASLSGPTFSVDILISIARAT